MQMIFKKGFTLVEILLVIGLVGIIAGITTPFIWTSFSRQQLTVTTDDVVANLRRAQNKSIINEGNTAWGINWNTTNYSLIQYPTETIIETFDLPEQIIINADNIKFQQLTGKPEVDTAIIVAHNTLGEQKTISINAEGKIQIQ